MLNGNNIHKLSVFIAVFNECPLCVKTPRNAKMRNQNVNIGRVINNKISPTGYELSGLMKAKGPHRANMTLKRMLTLNIHNQAISGTLV